MPLSAQAATKPAPQAATRPPLPESAKPPGYGVAPIPAWVAPLADAPDAAIERAPLHYRLIDSQIRIDDRETTDYSRVVRVINDASGLGTASQIELDFDPSFQTLVLHRLEIIREGKRSNRLDRQRIQLLQRETQLERRMYDGRMTLSIVLDDVRVGDQIDFAYSRRGSNPVFAGRLATVEWMTSQRGPVMAYRQRVLAPVARHIAYRAGAKDIKITSRQDGGLQEILFSRDAVRQFRPEANAPYEALLAESVQLSEFGDWGSVAEWGRALFAEGGSTSPALDQLADDIKRRSPDPAARLLAALQFVQRDIRYFGTEIGPNTHRPAAPDKVLQQRFGDCKDKVSLLLALLRRMDIAGSPVLVSTALRGRVDQMLPGPLAFDHVIARIELGTSVYWLDPTRGHQTGTLENRQAGRFGKGLILEPGQTGLAQLAPAFEGTRMSVEDRFSIEDFKLGATLESRVTYRSDLAESVREAVAAAGTASLQQQLAEPYLKLYPQAKALGDLVVEPAGDDDAITLKRSMPPNGPPTPPACARCGPASARCSPCRCSPRFAWWLWPNACSPPSRRSVPAASSRPRASRQRRCSRP